MEGTTPRPPSQVRGVLAAGQRRADTYRLASVLLVQELEPHLNHRTQKTIGYFSIPPKMVNNTAKSEINSSYTGTEKPL